jgi:flagellar motor switch/type III secretory pathway protein FliN
MDAAVQRAKETQASPTEEIVKDPVEHFGWMACHLSLEVAVSKFTVGDLLRLNKGSIVETACPYTSDVPLRANGLLIGWTEFEVIGNRLAVRITELA